MSWHKIELTSFGRPVPEKGETDILIESNVGLYDGKYKAQGYQNGRLYLSNQRICYVDVESPATNSIGLNLSSISKVEHSGRFLKSSPKISLFLKEPNDTEGTSSDSDSRQSRSDTPVINDYRAQWICPICYFGNTLPAKFSLVDDPLPACATCGIQAQKGIIEKALNDYNGKFPSQEISVKAVSTHLAELDMENSRGFVCSRCTFENDPSLSYCEMCGMRLVSNRLPPNLDISVRSDSPGPSKTGPFMDPSIRETKVSFRGTGDKIFYNQLQKAIQEASLRQKQALTSGSETSSERSAPGTPNRRRGPGILGLEMAREQSQQHNAQVLGGAFEDLQGLMKRAQDVIKLAKEYSYFLDKELNSEDDVTSQARRALIQSSDALGILQGTEFGDNYSSTLVTREMTRDEEIFHEELARQLSEFLDRGRVLDQEGGAVTLVDLFAMYNRSRGASLISPTDLICACGKLEPLKLPFRIREFKSGLKILQYASRTTASVAASIITFMNSLEPWQTAIGISAQDLCDKFRWSISIATEELEAAEMEGILLRDEQISGVRYFENTFLTEEAVLSALKS